MERMTGWDRGEARVRTRERPPGNQTLMYGSDALAERIVTVTRSAGCAYP